METGENVTSFNRRESRDCCIRCCRSCCVGCVCSKGILLLLTWSVLIHSFEYYFYFQAFILGFTYYFIGVLVVKAVVFLLYPVSGLLAEVCISRYKLMIGGTFLVLIGIVIAVPTVTVELFKAENCEDKECITYSLLVPVCFGLVLNYVGLGLFESNAIQFGTDQLQFASNDKLSVFINWYFWSLHFLNILLPITDLFYRYLSAIGVAILGSCSFFSMLLMLSCCCGCHSHFTTEPVGRINPVKHIFKVLNYIRHHSQPVFRSAFTYGEVPSRLDLAKNRYGGPFTTEEVEDVKTFGRILLVLISLFGFHLLPSTLSSLKVFYYDCDNKCIGQLPNMQYILPALLIPVHMLIIRPCFNRYTYRITILKKMGAGLILVGISSVSMTVVDVSLYNFIERVNSSSNEIGSPPNYIHSFIILSQFLNGLSLILVFLSALEFILAQGPRSMQGLLIGLWYAYQSVYVLLQIPSLLPNSHKHYWLTVLKTCLVFLLLILFIIVSYKYKYRQREESSEINQQAVIEEYTERQLIMARQFDYSSNTI